MTDKRPSLLSAALTTAAFDILSLAVRAFVVMILWNWVIPVIFTSIPTLAYGHAFVLVVLIAALFGNLNTYAKKQASDIDEVRSLLFKLTSNQIMQNNAILSYLHDILNKKPKNEAIVEDSTTELDEQDKVGYNTQDSENQKQ